VSAADAAWLTTERLVLRRPRAGDLDDYVRLHTDPRTYAHAPQHMPTPERCEQRLAADLADWEREGLGYVAVLDRGTSEVIGWAGLRHKDSDHRELNLYYRLTHDRLGAGLGREIARALVAWAVEHRPDDLVTAMVDLGNPVSLATAERAGLVQAGTRRNRDDPPDAAPMIVLESPSVRVVPDEGVDDRFVHDVVDLWVRVNDAGGAVGFPRGAPRSDVSAAMARHLGDVRAGTALLCVLRDPDGAIRGVGFWEHTPGFPYGHVAGLKRLMVDPTGRGRNLGRILLGGMVGIARRELPHVELLRLDYREGLGLGDFYAKAGWTEVGRIPRGLKLTDTDYRDDVTMARRIDGRPLRGDSLGLSSRAACAPRVRTGR
jgi:RimJ/RimL family protein N-acetyltransferase